MFDPLSRRYRFSVDLASTDENKLCIVNYTIERSSLEVNWGRLSVGMSNIKGRRTFPVNDEDREGWLWNNPPYSKPNLERFVAKARAEVKRGAAIVQLVPATPGAGWFQNHVLRGHDLAGGGSSPAGDGVYLQGFDVRMRGDGYEVTVRFLKRRITFANPFRPKVEGVAKTDSVLIEWRPGRLL